MKLICDCGNEQEFNTIDEETDLVVYMNIIRCYN